MNIYINNHLHYLSIHYLLNVIFFKLIKDNKYLVLKMSLNLTIFIIIISIFNNIIIVIIILFIYSKFTLYSKKIFYYKISFRIILQN